MGGLFLHGKNLFVCVKLHHAKALRVGHIVAEDGSPPFFRIPPGLLQNGGEVVAIENVVAQDHGAGLVSNEFLTDQESLRQTVRGGLYRIA